MKRRLRRTAGVTGPFDGPVCRPCDGPVEGSIDRLGEGPTTGWLVRDGRVLASVELAIGRLAKARGLLGRDHLDGALVIPGRRSVHSLSMGFDLDVAFLDGEGVVIRTMRLRRHRVTLPVWQARWVVEAEAGAFGVWELKVGDVLEIRLASGSTVGQDPTETDEDDNGGANPGTTDG